VEASSTAFGSPTAIGGRGLQGEIVTLSIQTKNVRIVPETNQANDNVPSRRVYVGCADYAKRSIMRSGVV
jgi:uncharacterized protein (DUF736 family)